MIKLSKLPEPEVLQLNAASWLKVIMDKLALGEIPTDADKARYRHPDIKTQLKAETHGKCAYCEAFLLHIAFGDVEHIIPKSLKIVDIFKWENLTLACDQCNTFKSNNSNLVDPYIEDPALFFQFLGPMIYPSANIPKAIITFKALRLNRMDLVKDRLKRLDAISSIILSIESAATPEVRDVLIEDLLVNETSDSSEYAAFVRSFILMVRPDLLKDG